MVPGGTKGILALVREGPVEGRAGIELNRQAVVPTHGPVICRGIGVRSSRIERIVIAKGVVVGSNWLHVDLLEVVGLGREDGGVEDVFVENALVIIEVLGIDRERALLVERVDESHGGVVRC